MKTRSYYDFTSMIDVPVGRVLDHLETPGPAQNTIVELRRKIMHPAQRLNDPLAPCGCKYFGHSKKAGGQLEATRIDK